MIKQTSYGLTTEEIKAVKTVKNILWKLAVTGEDFTDDTGVEYNNSHIIHLCAEIEAFSKGSVFTIKI